MYNYLTTRKERLTMESINETNIPKLYEWEPADEDRFFVRDPDGQKRIIAQFDRIAEDNGISELTEKRYQYLKVFFISQKHYLDRMDDIMYVINYFIKFYDTERAYELALLRMKFHIDRNEGRYTTKSFIKFLMGTLMTDSMILKVNKMVENLYSTNIDTDSKGTYDASPKLTNSDAKVILTMSFCFRLILPICLHWVNSGNIRTNNNKKEYIENFIEIFQSLTKKIESLTHDVYARLERLIEHRIDKKYDNDTLMHEKKKQVHGTTKAEYINLLITEIILVKSIYKIDYNKSVVSYIDGIIRKNYAQSNIENFKEKPVELSADELNNDRDDNITPAEALDMKRYYHNELHALITELNTDNVLKTIGRRFNVKISQEEFDFYFNNVVPNAISTKFLSAFYARFFKDASAIDSIDRRNVIRLLVIMKKFLQMKGMVFIPQICTARANGNFRENTIKNIKFNESYENSALNKEILSGKFRYINDLGTKDHPLKKELSTIINSQFTWVDFDPRINGIVENDIDNGIIIDEYQTFLSII